MLSPQFRRTSIFPVALIILMAAAIGYWSAQSGVLAAPAKDSKDKKVNSLIQERLTTLKEAAVTTNKAYENGIESYADVIAANQALRRAELDMCSTDQERVALLEKMVTEAKGYETIATQHALRGTVPASSGLRVKVNRLEAEIALERMRSK